MTKKALAQPALAPFDEQTLPDIPSQEVAVSTAYGPLPCIPSVWVEATLPDACGAKRADYCEPANNLDGDWLIAGVYIHITLYQSRLLLLDCHAYEPIALGRQMSLTRLYPLSSAGYAQAKADAASWLPGARAFIAHVLGLVDRDACAVFSTIKSIEERRNAQPNVPVSSNVEALAGWLRWTSEIPSPSGLDLERVQRALLWLEQHGYIGMNGLKTEWFTCEWLEGRSNGWLVAQEGLDRRKR